MLNKDDLKYNVMNTGKNKQVPLAGGFRGSLDCKTKASPSSSPLRSRYGGATLGDIGGRNE